MSVTSQNLYAAGSANKGRRPPVMSVSQLTVHFSSAAGVVKAAEDVSFDLDESEVLAIVGESGSGKSVTALSLLKLVQTPPGEYVSGTITVDGSSVLDADHKELEQIRGSKISMIFQNPRAALNPSLTVLSQLIETIRRHDPRIAVVQARQKALETMRAVGVAEPERVAANYPHQISGGMCQRIGLALALACNPKVLIADEPTTQLDAHVQAKILLTLKRLHIEHRIPIILITHDFGVVRAMASRIIVMYAGKIQEEGSADQVLNNPQHPYTRALIASVPRLDEQVDRLYQIPGQPPNLAKLPTGCSFQDRCPNVHDKCRLSQPRLLKTQSGSYARCHLFEAAQEASR
ncbi:putative oligopeptide/dipeptide ABC transporter, ATPase subunit (plasmid) [Sinorhizobium fredii HH103]|uniref:Oligopeptide/dipeptide ABC transporter, ATPase subunit n=1 Tax=Sinorhizobium fredii (strain HH103) TaxID=1117943 RepID=G9AJ80_SINF1|nr:ABC transporter ATP-binding protein [Sinorhizobium fredii]CCF01112.1 putative oligopeptide/dipeptide ABC transporter, ATPase subunit [Sinorhizobium fredii HH103]